MVMPLCYSMKRERNVFCGRNRILMSIWSSCVLAREDKVTIDGHVLRCNKWLKCASGLAGSSALTYFPKSKIYIILWIILLDRLTRCVVDSDLFWFTLFKPLAVFSLCLLSSYCVSSELFCAKARLSARVIIVTWNSNRWSNFWQKYATECPRRTFAPVTRRDTLQFCAVTCCHIIPSCMNTDFCSPAVVWMLSDCGAACVSRRCRRG